MVINSGQAMLEHMDLHINTAFCCDPEGRLRAVNEPEKPPAPRFYMVRTPAGNHWRFRYDLPAATIQQLDQLCQAEPPSADFARPPQQYAVIKAVLAAQAPLQDEYRVDSPGPRKTRQCRADHGHERLSPPTALSLGLATPASSKARRPGGDGCARNGGCALLLCTYPRPGNARRC